MRGWANVERHVAEEIVLLCERHHRETTSGLLPAEAVQRANNDPINLRVGTSWPYDLHYEGGECEAVLGGNSFTTLDAGYGTIMAPISVDGIALLGVVLGDGHMLLNLNIFDECNQLVLWIQNNELVYRPAPWDIELTGRRLVIREDERKILIDIAFEPPNRIHVIRGRFLCNGVEVLVRPDHLLVTNTAALFQRVSFRNVPYGVVIGPHGPGVGGAVTIPDVPRYLGDRSEALRWAREATEEKSGEKNG
jgi:trigger factor